MTKKNKFAPCKLVDCKDGTFSLLFTDFDKTDPIFEKLNQEGGGYGWHCVVEALVRMKAPKLWKKVGFDPEASMFVALSNDKEVLKQVAKLIRNAVDDPELLQEAIRNASPELTDWKSHAPSKKKCEGSSSHIKNDTTTSPHEEVHSMAKTSDGKGGAKKPSKSKQKELAKNEVCYTCDVFQMKKKFPGRSITVVSNSDGETKRFCCELHAALWLLCFGNEAGGDLPTELEDTVLECSDAVSDYLDKLS
jgi:hypothetical protein